MAKWNKERFNQMLDKMSWKDLTLWAMGGVVVFMLGLSVRQCSEVDRARKERRAETAKKIEAESQARELARENKDLAESNAELREDYTILYQKLDSCENCAPVVAQPAVEKPVVRPAAPQANPVRPQQNRPALTDKPTRPVVKKTTAPAPATRIPVEASADTEQAGNVVFQDNAANNGTVNVNNGVVNYNYNEAGPAYLRYERTTRVFRNQRAYRRYRQGR